MAPPYSSPSSSSSPPPPPFSLLEFGDLVALALDADHFSESFFAHDPEPRLLPARNSVHESIPSTPPAPTMGEDAATGCVHGSGPRRILEKIKRQASALVMRPTLYTQRPLAPVSAPEQPQPIPTVPSYPQSTHSGFSAEDQDFIPYLPLASQYERAASNSSASIFSRRASPAASPSSPKSTRSTSSSSTATEPYSPITPITPAFASSSSSSSSSQGHRWSLCTEDSYPPFSDHPYARDSGIAIDPFAKGSIEVVRAQGYRKSSARRRRTLPAPPSPPPSCPLPNLPPPQSECWACKEVRDNEREQEQDVEWTLRLGIPSPTVGIPSTPIHHDVLTQQTRKALPPTKPKSKPKLRPIKLALAHPEPRGKGEDWTLSLPLLPPLSPAQLSKTKCPPSWQNPAPPTLSPRPLRSSRSRTRTRDVQFQLQPQPLLGLPQPRSRSLAGNPTAAATLTRVAEYYSAPPQASTPPAKELGGGAEVEESGGRGTDAGAEESQDTDSMMSGTYYSARSSWAL